MQQLHSGVHGSGLQHSGEPDPAHRASLLFPAVWRHPAAVQRNIHEAAGAEQPLLPGGGQVQCTGVCCGLYVAVD